MAAFFASLGYDFINYDDPLYITENPHVNTGLGFTNLKWALVSSGEANLWGPLTYLSHQLDVTLFGLNPAGHHLVNVLWHTLAALFLFLTALRLTKSGPWSFFLALIWAIHPEKIQSVAWLSERKDVLSGAFFLASAYCFTAWKQGPKRPALYFSSLLLFVFALLSKPSAVPLPLALFLIFHLDLKNIGASLRRAAVPLAPYFAAALVVSGIALHFQASGELGGVDEQLGLFGKFSKIILSYTFYLERFIWPSPARIWFLPPGSLGPLYRSLALLALLAPLLVWLGEKDKLIPAGAALYTILWLPVSGLVTIGPFFVADRYSYLPQLGLVCVLIGLARLLSRLTSSPLAGKLALGAFAILLLVLQQRQLPLWKDSETLFSHEMAVNPGSLLAPIHYGEEFLESDPEKALRFYELAHRNDPEAGIALAKMGVVQKQLGRPEEALESFRKATRVTNRVPQTWTQLLVLQVELGLHREAEETIRRALESDPANWDFLMNAGNYHLLVRNRPDLALPYFRQARALRPDRPESIRACSECERLMENAR